MKLSHKINIILLLGLIIGFTFAIIIQIQNYNNEINKKSESALNLSERNLSNIVENEVQKLFMASDLLLENDKIKSLFNSDNSTELYNYLSPVYDNIKKNYHVSQIFFINPEPEKTCLLRMHRPEKKGDKINRVSFNKTVQTKSRINGLELGTRKFSLRTVQPYYDDQKLIGYIELSEEINPFFENLKQQTGDDFAVIVEHKFLSENGWDLKAAQNDKNSKNSIYGDQIILSNTNHDIDLTNVIQQKTPIDKIIINEQYKINKQVYIVGALPIKDVADRNVGAVYFTKNISEYYYKVQNKFIQTIILFTITTLILIILGRHLIKRIITKPMFKAIDAIKRLSNKQINVHLNEKRNDEIGELYSAINEVSMNFIDVINNINTTSKKMSDASQKLLSLSSDISNSSNNQAAATEEISSSMEETVSTLEISTSKSEHTGKIANNATKLMIESQEIFEKTISTIHNINDKISVIFDIATSTNLLALNASVEASQAGKFGAGFSVIAKEVRALAIHSENLATDIEKLSKTGNTTAAKAGELLDQVIPEIKNTSEMVQDIIIAYQEQKAGAEQINHALIQLTQIASKNSDTSASLSTYAENLSEEARNLTHLIHMFDTD